MDSKETLAYWIKERENIRKLKEAGQPAPWSTDPIMQDTYFCNVHREDDKVTRWIRNYFNQYVGNNDFEWMMCMARIFNWPATIHHIMEHTPPYSENNLRNLLEEMKESGTKIWGAAYVVTTHGQPISKIDYCAQILGDAHRSEAITRLRMSVTLEEAHEELMALEGFASFMAAQVVADLKNTPGHELARADDWWTFVAPGPGSKKGLNYFFERDPKKSISDTQFRREIQDVRYYLMVEHLIGDSICNQDLQNCLCEYSKYMRVSAGGRSKRRYPQ